MLEWCVICVAGIELRLTAGEDALHMIEFEPEDQIGGRENPRSPVLVETELQLRSYFSGNLRRFHLPLAMSGTPFQQRVWNELLKIPYGETRSYSEVAQKIGAAAAVRAVGAANGSNPIPIVVPCHRVIGSGGKLVGYGGGLPLKRRLLALERGSLFEKYET